MKLPAIMVFTICTCLISAGPAFSADADIAQRLDRIERLLQSQGLLDMLQQIEALKQEINSLQGEIELQNHTLEQLQKRQRDLYTDIDQRLQGLERAGVVDQRKEPASATAANVEDNAPPLPTLAPVANEINATSVAQKPENSLKVEVVEKNRAVSSPQPATQQQVATVNPPLDNSPETGLLPMSTESALDPVQIRAEYQQAFKLLKQAQYEQAIQAFRKFLLANPSSVYSDNAQYWLGEAFYVTQQYAQALIEYNKLVDNYPASRKLSHSLLKIGLCYYQMGQVDEAVNRLQKLKQQYPGTTAALVADERLKKITVDAQKPADKAR